MIYCCCPPCPLHAQHLRIAHHITIQRTLIAHYSHFKMVFYPLPKYISKTVLKKADPYEWSERDKRVSEVATTPTCLRCAQNVATGKKLCKKPEQKRCGHCVKGNRGGCFLVIFPLVFLDIWTFANIFVGSWGYSWQA